MSNPPLSQPTDLKGVIVGAGFFAGIQAEAWARLPTAQITAVVDPLLDKAQKFASQWGIAKTYSDIDTMLAAEKPDFVDVVTRPETHLELVEQIAAQGCHMICQKPMAPTFAECEAMVACCEQASVRLLIHENWRWQPWYREMKRLYQTESLGPIFNLGFQVRTGDGWGEGAYTVQPYFREMKRLLIYETLVHHLDTSRFFAGEITSLFCQTQRINPNIVGEDDAQVLLNFKEAGRGFIDANRINGPVPAPKVFGTVQLEAEQGAIRLDAEGRLWLTRYGEEEREHTYDWADQGYRGDSVFAAQEHYIQSLLEGTKAETEASDYLQTVRTVDACYASAQSNEPKSI